jgi:exopolysaccharide production protein ExoY
MQAEHVDIPSLYDVRHLPLKRICDILLSLSLLAIALPLFLILAILVKLSSKGPIFYVDERVGRGGKSFRCYKFRTMYPDAAERLADLLHTDAIACQQWTTKRKLAHDPRITPIGYWLRRTSLDELPQLGNVLQGQMSLVGPRPVTSDELTTHYGRKAAKILQVRPGMTGIWQTSGRSHTCYIERVRMDEHYVDHHSLLMDAKILLKTVPAVLSLRGAY